MKKNKNLVNNKQNISENDLWELVKKSANPLKKTEVERDIFKNVAQPLSAEKNIKEKKLSTMHFKDHSFESKNFHETIISKRKFDENEKKFMGIDKRTYSRLRKGKINIEDVLDMHGMSQKTAYKLMKEFIQESTEKNLRCVLIITGKGGNRNKDSNLFKENIGIKLSELRTVISKK